MVVRGPMDAYSVAHGRAALLLWKLVCAVWPTWDADWLADPCGWTARARWQPPPPHESFQTKKSPISRKTLF